MNLFQSVILGTVQGLTEFLPISSSAHLVFAQDYLNIPNSPELMAFDVFLHFGTLLAVVLALNEYILKIAKSVLSFSLFQSNKILSEENTYIKLFWLLIIATLPAGIIGVVFKSQIEYFFSSSLHTSVFLIITGFILWTTRYFNEETITEKNIEIKQALLIGIGQAFAILPGISRSGTTITVGLSQKLGKKFAAEFSFLLSVPVILGATILEAKKIIKMGICIDSMLIFIIGTASAFLTGYLGIKVLLKLIQDKKFYFFSYYCWIVGVLIFIIKRCI